MVIVKQIFTGNCIRLNWNGRFFGTMGINAVVSILVHRPQVQTFLIHLYYFINL